MSASSTCTVCFGAVIVVGVGFVCSGLFVILTLPHFQLDVVLSPSELADPQIRDATLALLKKAYKGNEWLMWTTAGAILSVIGCVGLVASLRVRMPQKETEVPLTSHAR